MKKNIGTILIAIIVITLSILGFVFNHPVLSDKQLHILIVLLIICASAALYCFVVGEISRNNSQMDKLWSIVPIAYVWVIAAYGNFSIRLIIMAILVTLWGIRLTFNFGRKGAYSIKFWSGVEDYRWIILRKKKYFQNPFIWSLFDLFFISMYQNFIVLIMTFPALMAIDAPNSFNYIDIIATVFVLFFLIIETIADEEQWAFHKTKKQLLQENDNDLSKLPSPYNLGFNTKGLWRILRHPNYLGEQGIWVSFYVFSIASGVSHFYVFNWTVVGSMLIILLFLGSSTLSEKISASKYPKYQKYQEEVFKYLPLKKFKY